MKTQGTGTFSIKNWDEKSHRDVEGQTKIARASILTSFTGDIEGDSYVEYLLTYAGEVAYFIGVEQVVGRIGERTGSFVLHHNGTFENGIAKSNWFIVPDSGTGDLSGLSGSGSYLSQATSDQIPFTFEYEIVEK